jgi:hypothetical protein
MSDTETPAEQVKGPDAYGKLRTQGFDEDFAAMDDPAFLAERKRVREAVEALTERMARLDTEFVRRAGIAWASPSQR